MIELDSPSVVLVVVRKGSSGREWLLTAEEFESNEDSFW